MSQQSNDRFEIRVWDPNDLDIIPQFIDVIHSAHDSPIVTTIPIFKWKHAINPAGSSIISYAVEKETNRVVALRTFAARTFTYGDRRVTCHEACDASTDPKFGRLGLFTRVMTRCLERADEIGAYFLIGYPNFNSRPGYKKVGCEDVGGIEYLTKPVRPLRMLMSLYTILKHRKGFELDSDLRSPRFQMTSVQIETMARLAKSRDKWTDVWMGERDEKYLSWRFLNHPLFKYNVVETDDGIAIVVTGNRGPLREGKIVEVFFRENIASLKKSIRNLSRDVGKQLDLDILSIILTVGHPYFELYKSLGYYKVPSNVSFYRYTFHNCPENLTKRPWAIIGSDFDTL